MPNASYRSSNPIERQISNLAISPFVIEGRSCLSLEGFYQGIKRSGEAIQDSIFQTFGLNSKSKTKPTNYVYFNGRKLRCGSADHHELIFQAQLCKYTQHEDSKKALLATGNSSITHNVGRDSEVYPAKVYCRHLTKIRSMLQSGELDQ